MTPTTKTPGTTTPSGSTTTQAAPGVTESIQAQLAAEARRFTLPAWTWSALAVVGVLLAIMVIAGGNPFTSLTQSLSLAPYLVLVALGQMLVITLGPGNIDVSVASVVSLASYTSVASSAVVGPVLGVGVGIATGAAVSAVSAFAILVARIPPIIATLATGLIATSMTLVLSDALRGGADAGLRAFVNARVVGIPVVAILVLLVTIALAVALGRTRFGTGVIATGQNERAARRAGLPVTTILAGSYIASGALAGLAGSLLAAFISPSTGLGSTYLLDSVAAVVIGGTLVAGGRPVPMGVWMGALFFTLLASLMTLVGWDLGAQNVLKGALVVLVVVIAGGATPSGRRTARRWLDALSPARRSGT